MIIELTDNYYIDIDKYNYTLINKYNAKTKQGEIVESEKVIGYYPNLKFALRRFLLLSIELDEDMRISIEEFIDKGYEEILESQADRIKEMLESKEHKITSTGIPFDFEEE